VRSTLGRARRSLSLYLIYEAREVSESPFSVRRDLRLGVLHTVFVIDRDGVSCSVRIFVLSYHHWDFQLLQSLFGKWDTNVTAWNSSCLERTSRTRQYETYLVCFIIQAIFSVVQWEAAMMRSPSFSLLSSSMTTKNSPRAKASKASSIGSNLNASGAESFVLVEGLPSLAGFEVGDDRGPDITGPCLKSAMGAIGYYY
jgi:hypothetical protein